MLLSDKATAETEENGYMAYLQAPQTQSLLENAPFQVLDVYKRDDPSFVQGLFWDSEKQKLVESTGLYGQSRTQYLQVNDSVKKI